MLRAAVAFFVLGLLALLLGAGNIAGVSFEVGQTLLIPQLQVVDRMNASAIGRTLLREIWWHTVSIVSLMTSDDRRTKAYKRGLELLKANLTPAQLNQFLTERCFEVV